MSFSGGLAYEIHALNAQLYATYLALSGAGQTWCMKLFGSRGVEAMRMEKGHLHLKNVILTDFDPFETNLKRCVILDKGDFVGRGGLVAHKEVGARKKLVTLRIHSSYVPAHGGASAMQNGRIVGTA